jgi:crotonobetainyl-CoA:carnitine CoA-transferase CaiB-like acyl-CoA transferase
MERALSDIIVLDLGRVVAMPFCTMLLADMGARVIKIESPEQGQERLSGSIKRVRNGVEERVPVAQYRERNKQAITLNLKAPQGVELFKELVKHADVVTENFSVGTMDRLGIDYETLKTVNPRLIYASITAFGQYGPYANQRGYDILAQAISGYMSITGYPDRPPSRSGQSISDYYAGMLCAFSIVSALHYRHRTGRGQRIDMALLDSLIIALDNLAEHYNVGGEIRTRAGNVSFTGSSSGVYRTADGHVAVAAGTSDPIWRRFCHIIGQPALLDDPKFATVPARREHQDEVAAIIQHWAGSRTKSEVVNTLTPAGVPAAPVNTVDEMVVDPQVQAREMFVECEHPIYGSVTITGTPLKLSETPGRVERLAPLPSEHNETIFIDLLGYAKHDLTRWKEKGVI